MITLIKPRYEIVNEPDWATVLQQLEKSIRTCYKSEEKITADSAEKIIRAVITRGHESTLEHISFGVRFICDRGVSHELVRHRICSFSQESTRYVNYGNKGMQFILPCWMPDDWIGQYICEDVINNEEFPGWLQSFACSAFHYSKLLQHGWRPEQARSVLPNSLKTEIVMTTNLRDWRHIFHLRCDKTAHPQMRELMIPLFEELKGKCPAIFDSVKFN